VVDRGQLLDGGLSFTGRRRGTISGGIAQTGHALGVRDSHTVACRELEGTGLNVSKMQGTNDPSVYLCTCQVNLR
jgi:hypothetical protein